MKRSSSPGSTDGPAQKRLSGIQRQILEEVKQSYKRVDTSGTVIWSGTVKIADYKRVDTSGTVIWSGTVKIPDSQKIGFDCSIKTLPQNEGIKSLLPLKQFTIHILPLSVWLSLRPHKVQLGSRLNLRTDENTDMMSYSAFSQAIRFGSDMRGCVVLKNTASALHLLYVASFSSEHEDYITGNILTYRANDTVLGILRSHSLLPCVNPEHNELENQNATLKEELQNKDKMLNEQQRLILQLVEIHKKEMAEKEEELVRLHQEVEEQKKLAEKKQEELVKLHQEVEEQKRLAEKKQEELATSQNERDMMKKAIDEKDAEIIVKDITMMENNETLMSLRQKIMELQNEKEQVEEQLHRVLMKDRCLDAEREIFQETNQSNIEEDTDKILTVEEQLLMKDRRWDADREIHTEEDTDKILTMETSRLELEYKVTQRQAALDGIDRMMENDFKCSICSQLFIKTTTLNCSHSFCAFCIQKWLSEKGTCPHCRTGVTASVRSVVLDNLIETIIDKLGDEAKERRKVTVREREHDISMQEGGHLCSIPEDVETDDETSTVSSPCSSLSHLSPSASLMSPYSCPPSSASTYWRSPASIANIFSPPSVLSTNSPSPACNNSNN